MAYSSCADIDPRIHVVAFFEAWMAGTKPGHDEDNAQRWRVLAD
jgi:hypothetical protein